MYNILEEALVGTWSLERTVIDRNHKKSIAHGHMNLTKTSWVERGTMNGMSFYQIYTIDMSKRFSVMFSDGREFYTLDSIHGCFNIRHVCGKDIYIGTWCYSNDTIMLQWVVTGLHKNYTMHSSYKRKTNL